MPENQTTLTATNNTAFKQRITISSGGTPTNLNDRTFKGIVTGKPGGVTLAVIQVTPRNQDQFPGQIDLYIGFQTMRRMPLNPQVVGFRLPTTFSYDITVTYANDQAHDPEACLHGNLLVYAGA